LRAELLGSEKDRAENIMIVDLARNDLGRVCEVDSIHVPQLMAIEEHPSVFQLVSTVRGQLAAGSSALQLLRACFPPGSMTGAPKIEAMKIIEALESSPRGLYSGCLGYFDCGGGMDFSVVIRSFLLQQGRCSIGVGGAVVADSDPGAEYEESRAKAHALLQALAASRSAGR
jgi:anthranilate/para-aminobenzoate synthase component I